MSSRIRWPVWVVLLGAIGGGLVLLGLFRESGVLEALRRTPPAMEIEPRTTRGRVTRSWPLPSREPADARLASVVGDEGLALELRLASRAQGSGSPEDLAALGLYYLYTGRHDEAIRLLRTARLRDSSSAVAASDLSVAHLERGLETGDPFDLLLAVEAAVDAVRLDPELPAARFNLALSLEHISLERRAIQAWEEYLELDSASEWSASAREHLRSLEQPSDREEWSSLAARLEAGGAAALTAETRTEVLELAAHLYDHAEKVLLPRWGEAVLEGRPEEAERTLELAEALGALLDEAGADRSLALGVRAIRHAHSSGDRATVRSLATGHIALADGSRLRRGSCSEAVPLLDDAEAALRAGGSPYAEWASFHRSVCRYFDSLPTAAPDFTGIRDRIDGLGLHALAGQLDWMIGLSRASAGDYAGALAPYRAAAESFATARDTIRLAGVPTLLCDAEQHLGRPLEAWRERLRGLAATMGTGDPEAITRALTEAVSALVAEGRTELALLFQDEVLAWASSHDDSTLAHPLALTTRAELQHRLGADRAALADLDDAAHHLGPETLSADRRTLLAQVDALRGQILAHRQPRQALPILDRSLASLETAGHTTWLPDLLGARASASLQLGDVGHAESDLSRAIAHVEEIRAATDDESLRISFFQTAQDVYDAMVRLQADALEDPSAAFARADQARSRGLLDRLNGLATAGEVAPGASDLGDRLQRTLPDGVALVEYAVLPNELLTWVLDSEQLRMVRQPVPAAEIERRTDLLRAEIEEGAPEAIRNASGPLFDLLVHPARPFLGDAERVVVVPDRALHGVPFGALYDRRSERFWIEELSVAVAPSASLLLATAADGRARAPERRSALVVSDPAFDRERFPALPPLPGAAAEGRDIAGRYAESMLLAGPAATPSAILENIGHYSVLQVGAHAIVDPRHPARSVLALAPDPGDPRRGALPASALAAAHLDNVEIAFVAACTTAATFPGSDREGVAGFARELLGARIPSVVASLWEVDDRATRVLATAFHRQVSAGVDPVTALRQAQLSLLRDTDPSLRSPAHWAGFQLYTGRLPADS